MDGTSIKVDTTELERFSVFDEESWKRFETTRNHKHLEELALYIPEKYHKEYNKAFKDYMNQTDRDVLYSASNDDEIRETRKEA